MSKNKKVSFFCSNLNEKRERVYHREKNRYVVEPVSMVLVRDKYYLTAMSPHREGLSVNRNDRMEAVQCLTAPENKQGSATWCSIPVNAWSVCKQVPPFVDGCFNFLGKWF